MHLRRNVRLFALVLCLTIVLSSFVSTALAATVTTTAAQATAAAVTTGSVNFRTGPGTNYSSQGKLARGTTVTVLDNTTTSGWWKVSYNGTEGYVTSDYLKLTDTAAPLVQAVGTATVKSATALRSGAGSGSTLCTIPRGAAVMVLDNTTNTKWWNVAYNGQEGYATSSRLKMNGADASVSAGSTAVSASDPLASKIANAKRVNSDTVGWIKVPNTNIDEPILYGANFYYATHNINKQKSYDGVYPYYRGLTKNVVVFGHNMRGSNSIFHQLHHLQEAALGYSKCQSGQCGRALSSSLNDWYKTASNRVWNISIYGKQKWEVFAMYEVKANEPISTLRNNWSALSGIGKAGVQSWIDNQIKRSQLDFGVSVTAGDQLMTLITCGTNYDSATANSRLFVFLKNVD